MVQHGATMQNDHQSTFPWGSPWVIANGKLTALHFQSQGLSLAPCSDQIDTSTYKPRVSFKKSNCLQCLGSWVWRLSCIYDRTWYQLITYVYHVLSCVIINSANWCSSLSLHFGAPKDMELIWLCVLAPPATKRATVNSLLLRTDATAMTCAQLMPVRWQMLEQLADAHGITWVPHKYHLAITWPSDTTCALNLCRAPRKICESTLMLERPRDFSKVAGQLSIRCRWLKQIEIGSSKQALETPWDLDIAGVYVLKPSPGIYEEFVKNATWCRTWCYFYHSYSCAFGPGHTSFPIRKHQNSIKMHKIARSGRPGQKTRTSDFSICE